MKVQVVRAVLAGEDRVQLLEQRRIAGGEVDVLRDPHEVEGAALRDTLYCSAK